MGIKKDSRFLRCGPGSSRQRRNWAGVTYDHFDLHVGIRPTKLITNSDISYFSNFEAFFIASTIFL